MKDATSGFYKLDNYFDRFDASFKANHKQVEFPNNVTLFVVTSIPDAVVEVKAKEFYQSYSAPRDGEMRAAWLDYWSKVAMVAVAPPLALLGLGLVLGWIFAGFKRQPGV
ncbi:hypothetical protein AC630_37060 [Bradyrhizobium sp. AS23.2]|nr:hypothetical protein AC630_37060 [Bradyrhizobium sp. AS23.2]